MTCSGGYGEDGFYCYNTDYWKAEGCTYKSGHCPGRVTMSAALELALVEVEWWVKSSNERFDGLIRMI